MPSYLQAHSSHTLLQENNQTVNIIPTVVKKATCEKTRSHEEKRIINMRGDKQKKPHVGTARGAPHTQEALGRDTGGCAQGTCEKSSEWFRGLMATKVFPFFPLQNSFSLTSYVKGVCS